MYDKLLDFMMGSYFFLFFYTDYLFSDIMWLVIAKLCLKMNKTYNILHLILKIYTLHAENYNCN